MERYTKRLSNGQASWNYPSVCYDENETRNKVFKSAHRQKACEKLAAYEGTGLEPEEIKSLQAEWGVNLKALESYRSLGSFDRLSELSEADKEGRIVVLPKIPNCDTCPLCGEYGECKITGYPPNPEKCREVIRKEAALKEAAP